MASKAHIPVPRLCCWGLLAKANGRDNPQPSMFVYTIGIRWGTVTSWAPSGICIHTNNHNECSRQRHWFESLATPLAPFPSPFLPPVLSDADPPCRLSPVSIPNLMPRASGPRPAMHSSGPIRCSSLSTRHRRVPVHSPRSRLHHEVLLICRSHSCSHLYPLARDQVESCHAPHATLRTTTHNQNT